jgi:hypothetical protein
MCPLDRLSAPDLEHIEVNTVGPDAADRRAIAVQISPALRATHDGKSGSGGEAEKETPPESHFGGEA